MDVDICNDNIKFAGTHFDTFDSFYYTRKDGVQYPVCMLNKDSINNDINDKSEPN